MKAIMITAPSSGSGKTTVTMGILRSLVNHGIDVCAFKTGPDYIDTSFLKMASRKDAGNLDMFLQGREGIRKALSLSHTEYAVIEGVMGYFDGIYNTFENSSYDIGKELNVNSILVYTPEGEMFTVIPKIKGMAEFKGASIKGVILNNVSESYYKLLKEQIEKYTRIKVLGYLPRSEDFTLESRHLGLIQCAEIEKIDEMIDKIGENVSKYVDLNGIINLMKEVNTEEFPYTEKKDLTVSIAFDKAFSFYYRENLKLISHACSVNYFSPLKDKKIPECDILYIGGGYPEVFKEELSQNNSMLLSLKQYAGNGGIIYAECGGLMYLLNDIDGCKMAGVLDGKSCITNKLQHFGYAEIELKKNCLLGKKGHHLRGQEFHKSVSQINLDTVYSLKSPMTEVSWNCGYDLNNVFAAYAHINFLGNMTAFQSIIDRASEIKGK